MTSPAPVTTNSGLKVLSLTVTKEGKIERKMPNLSPQAQLKNTLLEALCPGIKVASVSVTPEPLDQVERAKVESTLSRFALDGTEYRLIGASGSAKNGKYYAVDSRYERPLAARFLVFFSDHKPSSAWRPMPHLRRRPPPTRPES